MTEKQRYKEYGYEWDYPIVDKRIIKLGWKGRKIKTGSKECLYTGGTSGI